VGPSDPPPQCSDPPTTIPNDKVKSVKQLNDATICTTPGPATPQAIAGYAPHFSTAFRTASGVTPSDFRRAAMP
jgi:hypothetical protein